MTEWADIEALLRKVLEHPGFAAISYEPGFVEPWGVAIRTGGPFDRKVIQ